MRRAVVLRNFIFVEEYGHVGVSLDVPLLSQPVLIGGIMRPMLILLFAGFLVIGCQRKEEPTALEQHAAEGRLIETYPEAGRVLISHSDIPDFMPAMTMMFQLENAELLTNVQLEDSIHFTLTRTDSGIVITEINVIE